MINVKIGSFIKQKLIEKGMTQDDLAEKLSISKSAVSQALNGKNTFDLENLVSVSNILDVTLDELIKGQKSKNTKIEFITLFSQIVESGDIENLEKLESLGGNIFGKDELNKTVLDYAIAKENYDIIKFMLVKGITPPIHNMDQYNVRIEFSKEYIEQIRCILIKNNDIENLKLINDLHAEQSNNFMKDRFRWYLENESEIDTILSKDVSRDTIQYLLSEPDQKYTDKKFWHRNKFDKLMNSAIERNNEIRIEDLYSIYFENNKGTYKNNFLYEYLINNNTNLINKLNKINELDKNLLLRLSIIFGNINLLKKIDDNQKWNRGDNDYEDAWNKHIVHQQKGKFEYALESKNIESLKYLKSKTTSPIFYQELATYGYYDELKKEIIKNKSMDFIKTINSGNYEQILDVLTKIIKYDNDNRKHIDISDINNNIDISYKDKIKRDFPEDSIKTIEMYPNIILEILRLNKNKISGDYDPYHYEHAEDCKTYYYIRDLVNMRFKYKINSDFKYFIGLFKAVYDKNIEIVGFLVHYASQLEINYSLSLTDSIKIRNILTKNNN